MKENIMHANFKHATGSLPPSSILFRNISKPESFEMELYQYNSKFDNNHSIYEEILHLRRNHII